MAPVKTWLNYCKLGDINTTDTTTMGYYVIKPVSESYTLQEEIMCDGKISSAGELVVKYQYTNCMQDNTKWYWEQSPQQNNIIVPTRTIVHPCLDFTTVTEVKNQDVFVI